MPLFSNRFVVIVTKTLLTMNSRPAWLEFRWYLKNFKGTSF